MCVELARSCLIALPTRNLKVHQQDVFAVCTSSQGGNERIGVTGVHFSDLNPSFYGNLNSMKLDLNVCTKVRFSKNE